ncbi:MAG: phosphatase PAP2 family protein [Paludibacteraceae bacterium]|nr:phosphatase PAP2 family protein [Paludibacteraceae bacterium]
MLKRNAPFLFCSVLLLCVIGFVLLNYEKAEIHLWMNTYHTSFLDFFFRYYTVIGEWVPYIVVFLLLFYKAGWATYLLSSVVISGLLSQRLKYVFDTDRPYKYFADHLPDVQLPFVDGVELSKYYSFPSGHTTTFFALFLCLSIVATDYFYRTYHISKRSKTPREMELASIIVVSVTCFLLALTGAYSRIYLSQHFLEDIFGGMLLGILTTLLLYLPIPRLQTTRFWDWHIRLTPSKQRATTKEPNK